MTPDVPRAREQPVDQRDGQREERERPEEAVCAEEPELDVPCACGHQRGEQDASGPRVGRGLGIRDHEEREEHECAALEPVQRDAQRFAQPERPADEQHGVGREKGHRHIAPGRAVHDEPAGRCEQEAEHRRAAPLAGRDPHLAREQHHRHQGEVRGIEDVLAPDPQQELAGDGDGGRDDRQLDRTGPEQETEREPGDQGAPRVEDREPRETRRGELHQQDGGEDDGGAARVEPEPSEPVDQEAPEDGDLICAGVEASPGLRALSWASDGRRAQDSVHAP
jgi:hypothetical protein